jgi:hypothetical protein
VEIEKDRKVQEHQSGIESKLVPYPRRIEEFREKLDPIQF